MRNLILTLTLLTAPAHAACQGGAQVFSCQIGAKAVDLCHTDGALGYSFGPEGAPELTLTEPLETVAFTPWPGMGGSIWEKVAFPNRDVTYEVWTSFERDPETTKGLQGGINVLEGDSIVAELACDDGTASNALDVIYDLKKSIGQCWDYDRLEWTMDCPAN